MVTTLGWLMVYTGATAAPAGTWPGALTTDGPFLYVTTGGRGFNPRPCKTRVGYDPIFRKVNTPPTQY